MEDQIKRITDHFGNSSDLIVQKIEHLSRVRAAILYIDDLVDKTIIDDFVLKGIQHHLQEQASSFHIATSELKEVETLEDISKELLIGNTIVMFEKKKEVYAANTGGGPRRGISESQAESVVRGPKEAFNESLQANLGLIRRRLFTPKLRVEKKTVGKTSNTPIAILYIDGIAQEGIVNEVKQRIEKIDLDSVLESLYIEEMIEDPRGYTPFPTTFNTERPDRVAASLLEGRVAIVVEGTPMALVVPATFAMFMQSNEDYYQRYDIATFLRWLRTIAFITSIVVPGFYVSLLMYHQEMIPTPLLIALTGQREGVPFGIALEVVLMELTFEILREAGIRLPKTIGSAVSIVGGLVLGQAAVEAGLVAPATVIAVSFTAIASFVIPAYNLSIATRLIRFVILFLAAGLGAFGLVFGLIVMFIHLNSLRSFGVPYMSPAVPFHLSDWKDLFIRTNWRTMKTRPEEIAGKNNNRLPQEKNKS